MDRDARYVSNAVGMRVGTLVRVGVMVLYGPMPTATDDEDGCGMTAKATHLDFCGRMGSVPARMGSRDGWPVVGVGVESLYSGTM